MYQKRCIDNKIMELLKIKGAVNIKGIKWCGKTTTGEHFSNSQIYLQNPAVQEMFEYQLKNDTKIFENKNTPILIDEWQDVPVLWDTIRYQIDQRKKPGQFILTGSTSLTNNNKKYIRHSGIGRISNVEMFTMSLFESNDSTGSISLRDLFNNKHDINGLESPVTVSKLAYLICKGGWPESNNFEEKDSLIIANDYYKLLIDEDFSKYDGVKRNKELCKALMESLARNISTSVSISTISNDVRNNFNASDTTIESYLSVLNGLFVTMQIQSWRYQLRTSTSIKKAFTRYFTDPSIAASALGATPSKLMEDFKTFGFFFENLCVRDLAVYSNCLGGSLYKFQDRYGMEIDSIIELGDGSWGAFEIKLGEKEFEKAADNLITLSNLMLEKGKKKASFLAILSGTKYAYERADGVLIIPIGCLRD